MATIGPDRYPGAVNFQFQESFNYLEYKYILFDFEAMIAGEGRGYGNPSSPTQSHLEFLQRVARARLNQFVEFLRQGRTAIVVASPIPTHGTSDSQFVQTLNIFRGYPWEKMRVKIMRGATTGDLQNLHDGHLATLLGLTEYTYTIQVPEGVPLAFATGTKEPICLLQNFGGGRIVYIQKPRDKGAPTERVDRTGAFVSFLLGFLDSLDNRAKTPPVADWTVSFFTKDAYTHRLRQREIERAILELTNELDATTQAAEESSWFRQLLGGTGTPLEDAAKRALEILGVTIESLPSKENADVIGRWENQILAIEVKGISGNLKRNHIRQAIEWKHRADSQLETDDTPVHTKGMVIIVPHREKPVNERSKEAIHANEIAMAKENNVGIVTGDQLLAALSLAQASPDTRKSIVGKLFTESGLVTFTDDPMSLLIKDE